MQDAGALSEMSLKWLANYLFSKHSSIGAKIIDALKEFLEKGTVFGNLDPMREGVAL